MNIVPTELPGVVILEPKVFGDPRGWFVETWSQKRYEEAGIRRSFVQDNVSFSRRGILRGLHYQYPNPQGKLVQVLSGEVFDVAVDIRVGSPTFGKWVGVALSADNHRQMYIPPGFAHGFCVTSETALFSYKCTDYYNPAAEGGILFSDPAIGIDWPVESPVLSEKDAKFAVLQTILPEQLPQYEDHR
ncbi:MAG: dTDP-4-dehydrorhamnose 3,5-epimerase [Phycisphaerae bacterium]|nr:dTDP-4-dehydrorhamnose 3,5-epimerase [Phycisphaerae bacterium]